MIPKYRDIVELIKKGSTIEAQEKIMELREAAIELQEENSELKQEVRGLRSVIEKKKTMSFKAPFYYAEGDDVPHCPRCWEVEHKAVHFPEPSRSALGPCYSCFECKTTIIHPKTDR